ncbi:MAG: 4-hydroxy-3-methylbut-2-enyl diphosphate reductase [Actinobacteria bacterium]|nr:MAG: 4-hydroxy-3-methylbut-2-enyl diphosphate reductase [Actinomycetota bacterium]
MTPASAETTLDRLSVGRKPGELLVLAPLRIEARAVRRGLAPGAQVIPTGVGPRHSLAAASTHGARAAVAVSGFCGAVDPTLAPGDLVVATEIRGPGGVIPCPSARVLASALRRRRLRVRVGPIVSTDRLVRGSERRRLRATGALAVDTESAWLAGAADGRPLAVVRAVVDHPAQELRRPLALVNGTGRGYWALRQAAGVLSEWASTVRPRTIMLAAPRASCAGVERAIDVVELALARFSPPVYVRRQIVHNAHVVSDLERRGAVFVDEIDEIPDGSTVVFSAHGVAPAVRRAAGAKRLNVIDATCPLVSKVHGEARRFAEAGYTIVLVGHEGHDEVEGTVGEAPDHIHLVSDQGEVQGLEVEDPQRVAYLTQTTLAVDDAKQVVDALRERFPRLAGPPSSDICYATQNRQDAIKLLARECDFVLVVGSANSSNSRRLVEVAERHGTPARLIEDESAIELHWLARAPRIGLTAGASAPESVVRRVLAALTALGPADVVERRAAQESRRFKLPPEIRSPNASATARAPAGPGRRTAPRE